MGGNRDDVPADVSWFNLVRRSLGFRKDQLLQRVAAGRTVGLAAFVMVLVAPISASADWPERQVKLIVTFPPGRANDAAARIFADALGQEMGQARRRGGSGPAP